MSRNFISNSKGSSGSFYFQWVDLVNREVTHLLERKGSSLSPFICGCHTFSPNCCWPLDIVTASLANGMVCCLDMSGRRTCSQFGKTFRSLGDVPMRDAYSVKPYAREDGRSSGRAAGTAPSRQMIILLTERVSEVPRKSKYCCTRDLGPRYKPSAM